MKRRFLTAIGAMLLLLPMAGVFAREVVVSPSGNDAGAGTVARPFRTIQRGIRELKPGDELLLRGGTYREEVTLSGLKGEPGRSITIRPYDGEEALLDGTVELKGLKWRKHPTVPNVWQAKIEQDVWQLFIDGRMMINARWPNAEHPFENEERSTWWDRHASWCHVQYMIDGKVVSGFDFERAMGFLVEDGMKGLAATGRSFNGCMGVLNVNSMDTLVGRIVNHKAGTASFEYEVNEELQAKVRDPKQNNLRRILTKNASHAYFYFEGGADLIDTPDEWAYDKTTKTLFLYATDARDLQRRRIQGKVQSVALRLENCAHVTVRGLDFFATCLQATDCRHLIVEDNRFDCASYSKRMLGSLDDIKVLTIAGANRWRPSTPEEEAKGGTHNIFRNNVVRYTDGRGLHVANGGYDVVDNNCFSYIDISGAPGGTVGVWATGWRNTFSRNTLDICGSSKAIKNGDAGRVFLNRVSRFGYLQDDGTAFQAAGRGQQGTVFSQNWVHDSPKSGLRFDGNESVDAFARETFNGSMVRNVVFNNNGGLMVKGDDHRVYNNLCYNTQNESFRVLTSDKSEHSNHETVTRNNLGDFVNASRRGSALENPPVGPTDHNWVNHYAKRDIRELLRDPDNLDFRPRAGADEIIDKGVDIPAETLRCGVTLPDFTAELKRGAAPDIGAYEFGAEDYWIAGCRGTKASTPIPPDGCVTAKADADLMWLPAYRATAFRVYLGTSAGKLRLVSEQTANVWDPGPLDPTLTYTWRVDCRTAEGWGTGDVWRFRARGRPFRRGTGLPSSYVADFAEVYDFDPNNLAQNERGLIMPWIAPKRNGDHLDIRNGAMAITPASERVKNFEPVTIPKVGIDLATAPFLSLTYRTQGRKAPIGLYLGYASPGGKTRRVFIEEPLASLRPSPDTRTTVQVGLGPLLARGKAEIGSTVASIFLLQINGPDDVPWQQEDGAVVITDFRLGFACLLPQAASIRIEGQAGAVVSRGQPVRVSHEDLKISIATKGSAGRRVFPAGEPLPVNWHLELSNGDGYTVVDGDTIRPEPRFSGKLSVPVTVVAGEGSRSNVYALEIAVDDKIRGR